MSNNDHSIQRLAELIQLVRKGDHESLAKVREQLGKTREEIAKKVGVSERQLGHWEQGVQEPSSVYHVFWKLRLSDHIDNEIAMLLGTENAELITQFWEIMWRLND